MCAAASPNWADIVLEKNVTVLPNDCSILPHNNYPKSRLALISSDPQHDQTLVDKLKKDPRTDKVTYKILPLKDHCLDTGLFKDEQNKETFIEKVRDELRPTVILIKSNHTDIFEALKKNKLTDKQAKLIQSVDYDFYSTLNMTIMEPVILTFSVVATPDQVCKLLKKMLKENKIPNNPNTRVLWIDGGHGLQLGFYEGEFRPVGGESGLSDEDYLNSWFYELACQDLGTKPNPSHFKSQPRTTSDHTEGDFKKWNVSFFARPDICRDPVVLKNLPSNSLLNDPELNQMKVTILNIANYHNRKELRGKDKVKKRSEEFLKDVENFDPTVIFIGWCYSANGDVALALRASPIFSLMLLEHDVRKISNKSDAKLDPAQREIVVKISNNDIHHCVLAGSSGTGKTLLAAEFVKNKAAKILRENTDVKLDIIVCRLYAGEVDDCHLYQVWKEKYFQALQGFHITYLSVGDLCKRFNIDYGSYVDPKKKKCDMVGLINAVCVECDKQNVEKNSEKNSGEEDSDDENRAKTETIFLFDETLVNSVDKVCDFTALAELDQCSTVHSVTCVNPREQSDSGDAFTVALPENCSVPCTKGPGHKCIFSAQLNVCYRNTEQIRQFLQYFQDHGDALISRENDKPGVSLPPGLSDQQSAVTWVQCDSMDNVEKSAAEMINKIEQVDKEAELVILFKTDEEGRCSEIAHKVKGQHQVFDYLHHYGCECDIVIYITNHSVQPEAISRPRKKLVIISGPDLAHGSQFLLKIPASSQHKYNSVRCPGEPCPWSDGWTPLLQHVVFCGNCGDMMGRSSEVCTQCGHKYEESTVLVRYIVKYWVNFNYTLYIIPTERILDPWALIIINWTCRALIYNDPTTTLFFVNIGYMIYNKSSANEL